MITDLYITAREHQRQRRICLCVALPGAVAAVAWLIWTIL
jgi:hypothetical protein